MTTMTDEQLAACRKAFEAAHGYCYRSPIEQSIAERMFSAGLAFRQMEVDEIYQQVLEIHNYAHDRSTGPEEPDALWAVREMASTILRPDDDSPAQSEGGTK